MDITYHYPPELFSLLVDTIPLLFRSKKDVFLFFWGAGVEKAVTKNIYERWQANPDDVKKYEITRTIIQKLNELGEPALKERREVLMRVTKFEDFSTCWPNDQLKAKGLVGEIRRVVNVKDSFTRMKQEREKERQKHQRKHEARIKAIEEKQKQLDQIKDELFSLFGLKDSKKRGKLLEGALDRLFKANDILVRDPFELVGENQEGIIEQIDGVVEIDGYLYLVEMKWWDKPIGKKEIAPHLVKVFNRGHAGGILISASSYTEPAIIDCKEALSQKIVILCELEEIVTLLEKRANLKDFLKTKINVAVMEKKPLFKPLTRG
jgi:restriction system protein